MDSQLARINQPVLFNIHLLLLRPLHGNFFTNWSLLFYANRHGRMAPQIRERRFMEIKRQPNPDRPAPSRQSARKRTARSPAEQPDFDCSACRFINDDRLISASPVMVASQI
ncbi:hypothetical protein [Burkholderia latens]|uniref:hypothetical protein n=1 Tax=Burkholderia latens TaxID=488446 RepID=UPI00158F6415|nr:hypothetical protein [Burkholderia latens]